MNASIEGGVVICGTGSGAPVREILGGMMVEGEADEAVGGGGAKGGVVGAAKTVDMSNARMREDNPSRCEFENRILRPLVGFAREE